MKWHLYKKDDPNTWPKIDCPMVVYKEYSKDNVTIVVCTWDKKFNKFYENAEHHYYNFSECYYAYIGYVPSGYKTHKVLKCMDDSNCKIGCCDDGYCMYDFCECEQQREINEYEIETMRIWKEFEE